MTVTMPINKEAELLKRVFGSTYQALKKTSQTVVLPDLWPAVGRDEDSDVFAKVLANGRWDESHPIFSPNMPSDIHNVYQDIVCLRDVFGKEHMAGGPSHQEIDEEFTLQLALRKSLLSESSLSTLVNDFGSEGLICFERTSDPSVRRVRAILVYRPCDAFRTEYWLLYRDFALYRPPLSHLAIVMADFRPESGYAPLLLLGAMFGQAFSQIAADRVKGPGARVFDDPRPIITIDMMAQHRQALDFFDQAYHREPQLSLQR